MDHRSKSKNLNYTSTENNNNNTHIHAELKFLQAFKKYINNSLLVCVCVGGQTCMLSAFAW